MKKIMVLAGGYLPAKKYGGPVVSIDNLCTLLSCEFEMYVVAVDHDLGEKKCLSGIKKGWNERENCKVLYLSDDKCCLRVFREITSEIKPDLIYLNSLFDKKFTPAFLKISQEERISLVLSVRGQLCNGAIKKSLKKRVYIAALRLLGLDKNIVYHSTSGEETQAIRRYMGTRNSIIEIANIPSIPKKGFSYHQKKSGSARIVFLSRIHPKKNLSYAIELLSHIHGNVIFDIYGPLEDEKYWEKCRNAIEALPKNVSAKYCGLVSHDEVHKVFAQYDVFLFPTMSENYGHVIAESLAAGTAVITTDQTPWHDIKNLEFCEVSSLDDKECIIRAIQTVVDGDDAQMKRVRHQIMHYMNEHLKIRELETQYKRLFQSKQ